ncbi:MAG: MATE family efflux transporter [Bacteroidaceae bacterium]
MKYKYTGYKDTLLNRIRNHESMTGGQQYALAALLSVPGMLAQLVHILMQYIDASMVGSLGASASASIGIVSTTLWLFGSLCSSASVGFYVQVAHRIGAGEMAQARQVLRQSFLSCLLFAGILSAVGISISSRLPHWLGGGDDICYDASLYFLIFSIGIPFAQLNSLCSGMLRCSGNMHVPSMLNILMCLLDVVFNYFLIFPSHDLGWVNIPGAGLGVVGAGLGTLLSFIICSLMMCWFVCVRSRELNLRQDSGTFIPQVDTLCRATRIALPLAVEHIVLCGAQIISTIIVAPLGTIAIAANSFGITIEALCYMPGYGIADAATALVGQSLGAGRMRLARSFGRITLSMGVVVMTLMAVVMYVFSPALMSVMSPDESVCELTVSILRIEAFAEPMFAASIVCYGIFVGAGDTLIPCSMNLASIWVVRIVLAAFLAGTYGLQGVWAAMAVELTFRGLIFLIRFHSDNWIKDRRIV